MGGLGGFMAKRMGGADASKPTYPTARAGGMTGQYLDIALHNALKPGAEAQDLIPGGLKLGKSLTLIPIEPSAPTKGDTPSGKIPDVEVKITEYWGCSATVRPGQPKVATFKVKGGGKTINPNNPMGGMQGVDVQTTGSLSRGQYVPDRDIDLKPGYVYWPNRKHGKQVPSGAPSPANTGSAATASPPRCSSRSSRTPTSCRSCCCARRASRPRRSA
jgi:hypothetical protein